MCLRSMRSDVFTTQTSPDSLEGLDEDRLPMAVENHLYATFPHDRCCYQMTQR